MNDITQKINDIFTFVPSTSCTVEQRVQEYSDKVDLAEVVVKNNDDEIKTLEDKEYISKKLKNVIDIGERVLEVLESEISQGAQATRIEAFSMVLKEISMSIEKLQNLNKLVLDLELMQNPINTQPQTQNNVLIMDSKAALEMIKSASKEARENSELNDIELDFDNK